MVKEKLKPDEILIAEFNYIAQTAFQANEDRARVTNFFLTSIGSLIIALFSWNSFKSDNSIILFVIGGFFILLTVLGILTILQLARLRQAWFESIQAMNQTKDYYENDYKGLNEAFRWKNSNKPDEFKPTSVGFYLALQVALLCSVSLAVAIIFFGRGLGLSESALVLGGIAGLCSSIIIIYMYKYMLEKEPKSKTTTSESA